jgi:NAD(P)-dependent dehydrogenase (short-subunit alcohol dehydrogenase family)
VFGLARDTGVPALQQLRALHPSRLHLVTVDLLDQESVERAGDYIRAHSSRVDLLINSAAVLGGGGGSGSEGPERQLDSLDRDWLRKSFEVRMLCYAML